MPVAADMFAETPITQESRRPLTEVSMCGTDHAHIRMNRSGTA
jgi:hypothetical protein